MTSVYQHCFGSVPGGADSGDRAGDSLMRLVLLNQGFSHRELSVHLGAPIVAERYPALLAG